MTGLFLLSETQMARIAPHFPLPHGVPRVDDRRVVSGIVYVIKHGLQWKDAPKGYGRTRRSTTGSSAGAAWACSTASSQVLPLKGQSRADHDRRHAPQGAPHGGKPAQKGALSRCIGRTKGGLNSKLHAVCDGEGKPLVMLLSEGQMSDHKAPGSCFLRFRLRRRPSATAAMIPAGSAPRLPRKPSRRAFPRPGTARSQSRTTRYSTDSATKSRTCLANSRTGGASQPATTDAPTPSSRRSASQTACLRSALGLPGPGLRAVSGTDQRLGQTWR